jgi:HEPN domain-containing protein
MMTDSLDINIFNHSYVFIITSPLHEVLLEIARLDYNASKILASNGLIAQSLFYNEQAFEKANKSVIVYYHIKHDGLTENEVLAKIKNDFGHVNRKATATIVKILVDKEKAIYLSKGGSEKDEFIVRAYQQLDMFKENKPIQEELIPLFNNVITGIYNRYYIHFSTRIEEISDSRINYLHEQYSNPMSRYQMLAWILSSHLDGLDIYARYPVVELGYNNIRYLNHPENKQACNYLSEMIFDFIEVVPSVWQKIDEL